MKSKRLLVAVYLLVLAADLFFAGRAAVQLYRPGVLVEWKTASELNTVGFYLYRSEQAGGPFIRLTGELVPASSDPLAGGDYSYVDRAVQAGRTYYYRLEEVEADGTSTQIGETQGMAVRSGLFELCAASLLALVCLLGLRFALRLPAKKSLEMEAIS